MSQPARRPPSYSLLLYLVIIGLGVAKLVDSRALTTGGRVWAWIMIGGGAVGLLLALLGRLVPARTPEEGAKILLDQQKQLYGGAHEYRRVTAQAFEGLDVDFYESNRTRLETLGFRYLGDVENVTVRAAWPRSQAVLRVMVGDGGTVMAAMYHLRFFGSIRFLQLLGLMPKLLTIDLESELSNGGFVCTSNTMNSDTTAPFPGISKRRFPADTPVEALLEAHRIHLRDALAAAPELQPRYFASLEDVLESQNRQEKMKSAHKKRIGSIDERELKSVLQKERLDVSERRVLNEVRALQSDEPDRRPSCAAGSSRNTSFSHFTSASRASGTTRPKKA